MDHGGGKMKAKLNDKIERALDRGMVLKGKSKKVKANVIIGKGTDSLEKFLRGGPRGEAAQDAFDHDFFANDNDY